MKGPVIAVSPEFLKLLKEEYLEPPPLDYNTEGFSIHTPVWRKLVDWQEVQQQLQDVWGNQPPGFFVEIGAVDGEFMSQSIYLERNLSWTGLLVEPDPRSYSLLKEMKRNAWTSPLCINMDYPSLNKYWLRTLEYDLPRHFQQILLARSKLNAETMIGDDERGTTIWVLCAPLTPLLLTANFTQVDLLSIATGADNDEDKIKDVIISKKIDVKTILIQYPTSRFYDTPYPQVRGYILDMEHSQLLVKFYVKATHCVLVQQGQCKTMKYYDTLQACEQYFCLGHLTVWSHYRNVTKHQ
ncbi:hypothetical protein FHG87_008349 [Trinorchestia longiramus]|nr:hypothetical protein FHG87_008349 [Trinorchestia longiramus]